MGTGSATSTSSTLSSANSSSPSGCTLGFYAFSLTPGTDLTSLGTGSATITSSILSLANSSSASGCTLGSYAFSLTPGTDSTSLGTGSATIPSSTLSSANSSSASGCTLGSYAFSLTPGTDATTLSRSGSDGPTGNLTTATGSAWASEVPGSTSSAPVPKCSPDGAPWMSPASFCNCGKDVTYPTISPISGASTPNCAYTVLPLSTIKPVTTTSPPMNIPGKGGIPGCNLGLAHDLSLPSGSSDFCNCGGVTASILITSVSGSTSSSCAYSTVPPGGFNPVAEKDSLPPRPPPPPPPPPPYATGRCNVHVWEGIEQDPGDKDVYLQVTITDNKGTQIGYGQIGFTWSTTMTLHSKLADAMRVTPHGNSDPKKRDFTSAVKRPNGIDKRAGGPVYIRPAQERDPVAFSIGAQSWDSASSQCSVGQYDNGNAADFVKFFIGLENFVSNRQMDCKFNC